MRWNGAVLVLLLSCASRASLAQPRAGAHAAPRPPMNETLEVTGFEGAARAFVAATNAAAGPERDVLLRKAARMNEVALLEAPEHHDAPEAALRAASSYAQAGDLSKAIRLEQLVLEHYGDDVQRRATASDALLTLYLASFAYARAADTFAWIASEARFDRARRANAAFTAMDLYSSLGDRTNVIRMHHLATSPEARASDADRARADYLLASFDFRQWSAGGSMARDEALRPRAIAALTRFRDAYRGQAAAAPYVLEADSRVVMMNAGRSSPVSARSPGAPGILDVIAPTGLPTPSP